MTIIGLVLLAVGIFVVGSLAYWAIKKFFEPPVQSVALAIVGVLLLIVLLYAVFPQTLVQRIW